MHKIDPASVTVLLGVTIKEVIEKLNDSSEKIVVVVDNKQCLIGVITDGDVRRAILKDNNLDRPADEIISSDPVCVQETTELLEIRRLMTNRKIEHIPVVNSEGVLLHVFRSVLQLPQVDCEAVIMAGGQGKRLRPYTENTPKPLMKLGEKTIIERLISHLSGFGVSKFYVSVNYLAGQIEEQLGAGTDTGVNIEYLREKVQLGTAGSIALIEKRPTSDFIVLNGDITTKIDIQDLLESHKQSGAIASVAVTSNEYTIPYGVVDKNEEGMVFWQEKPSLSYLVSIGIYVLSPEIFEYIGRDSEAIDMPELLMRAQRNGRKLNIFTVYETWKDIGTPEDLISIRKNF